MRAVADPKPLSHREPYHPHDPITAVDDERQGVAIGPGYFPIDEEILQLPGSRRAKRAKAISLPAASNSQRSHQRVRRNCYFVPSGRERRSRRKPW